MSWRLCENLLLGVSPRSEPRVGAEASDAYPSAYYTNVTSILAAILMVRQEADVAFDFKTYGGVMVVEVQANGDRPLRLLVDTGSRVTVVDSAAATRLGLGLGETAHVRGQGGTIEARFVKGLRIAGLGDSLQTVAFPLDALGKAIGVPLDGILGQDFLARRVVTFDAAAGRVTLGTRPPVVTSSDTVLSLRLRGGRPFLMATVVGPDGGMTDAELLLDSGSDTTAELAQPYADEVGLRTRPDPSGRRILGIGGSVPMRVADIREIRVGRVSVPSEDVRVFARPPESAGDGDGRVGNGFLSRFKAVIDGPGQKLILTRR